MKLKNNNYLHALKESHSTRNELDEMKHIKIQYTFVFSEYEVERKTKQKLKTKKINKR